VIGLVAAPLVNFAIIVLSFVGGYGLTSQLITPVQEIFFPDVTDYASLVFLPHGVRVLAVMFFGWRAILPLLAGHWISDSLFGGVEGVDFDAAVIAAAYLIGSVCAFFAFEIFRFSGKNLYATDSKVPGWRHIILVGALASILNSIGQVCVYGSSFDATTYTLVSLVYAVGDLVGLIIAMICLMFIFRWVRFAQHAFKK